MFHSLPDKSKDGTRIPAIGFGTYKMDLVVKTALDAGYRLFDCAHVYQNEAEFGRCLAEHSKAQGISREDLFVVSKLWNTYHRPELVTKACKQTLSGLKLDYLDLYLIHWPVSLEALFPTDENGLGRYDNVSLEDTWRAMEELVSSGLVKSIGLSNFNKRQIQRILDCCSIRPSNLQVESHLAFMNDPIIDYAKSVGMTVAAYCPLGAPAKRTDEENILKWPVVCQLAEKYGKTPGQILLRHAVQRGLIAIPKSSNPGRIRENISVSYFIQCCLYSSPIKTNNQLLNMVLHWLFPNIP
ncbi:unnamed protein product [Echinostoma caproni]|uniref:Aldo_ket_red domain-containing protein n=1 Tax=Echinostoma caproni TaxID=27848 RepID=A0A183B2N0_9TREM|nr:unnamed protein product [Echinostoma caproni]